MKIKSRLIAGVFFLAASVLYADYSAQLAAVEALGDLTNAPAVYPAAGFTTNNGIRAVFYDGQDYAGSPTRVFAWVGIPTNAPTPMPAVVLVHGGGGTAFRTWVEMWNERGYAAIAMDTEGRAIDPVTGDTYVHSMGGPQRVGIYGDMGNPIGDHFMYHAVADTILANSLLRSLPEVDPDRIGVMGISWGGVITSTVMGIDDRFRFAIPVYGCGDMDNALNWWGDGLKNNEVYKNVWDPTIRMGQAQMPALWFSWPKEQNFPIDRQAVSYFSAPGEHMVSLVPGMNHSHGSAWTRPESYDFADNILSDSTGWCVQQSISQTGTTVEVVFATTRSLKQASLVYTRGTAVTGDLYWPEINATSMVESPAGIWTITAELPADATGWFINTKAWPNVSGYRGGDVIASSDYVENISAILSPDDQLQLAVDGVSTRSTGTVWVAFTAPSSIKFTQISITNESHSGAFSCLRNDPWLLLNPYPSSEQLKVEFNNSVAGLALGETATATLVMVWNKLDGSSVQVSLPIVATATTAGTVVYDVSADWSSKTVSSLDDVIIRNGAVVTLNQNDAAASLIVNDAASPASGTLRIDQNVSLIAGGGLSLGAGSGAGFVFQSDGTLRVPSLTVNSSATGDRSEYHLSGGTIFADDSLSVNAGGAFYMSGGTVYCDNFLPHGGLVEISGGSFVDRVGQVYLGKTAPAELRVVGDAATISLAYLNQQAHTAPYGTLRFVLDESGISPIAVSGFVNLTTAQLVVDGSAYAGGDAEFPLITAGNLNLPADTNNITLVGFEENGLTASVVQDLVADKVLLAITAPSSQSKLLGQDDFDGSSLYSSRTINSGAHNSANLWAIVNRQSILTADVIDTSVAAGGQVGLNPSDTLGFLGTNKTDNIFGMYRNNAAQTLVYTFDISGCTNLQLAMDWAISGDIADKNIKVSYSIDGGGSTTVFDVGSSGSNWNETMDNGTVLNRNRSASVKLNGATAPSLSDIFQTYTADIGGAGSSLTVSISMASTVGGFGGAGLDNLRLTGVKPAPTYAGWVSGYGLAGMDASVNANPEGDPFNNYEEYIAGLNPSQFDAFAISNFAAGASNALEWAEVSGRIYKVYWSSNLLDGFTLVESNAPGGAFSDTNHVSEFSGFYKITVELE